MTAGLPRLAALLLQAAAWSSAPPHPTVGDTIWLERTIPVPAGWRMRAGRLDPAGDVEPLADPALRRVPDGWSVRYPVVAWTPGPHSVELPPLWRLGPDGQADSLPGSSAEFVVHSVLPAPSAAPGADSSVRPAPKEAMAPLRPERRSAGPPLAAALAAAGVLAGGLWWRRRPPRTVPPPRPLRAGDRDTPDGRWLEAGEPKAVAARAAQRLRAALAAAVPGAHAALSTGECLAVLERAAPHAPLRDLAEVLRALDQVAFATAHGDDVGALAERARRLAAEIAR
jgi:hypothetical protein